MCTLSIYKLDSSVNEQPVCVLNEGEHVLGRGESLGCNDKRASRTHALIQITGGNVTITSIHQNPCFFQAANSKTVIILSKDVPADLKEGDKFGLFPDQYWFRVKLHDNSITGNVSALEDIIPKEYEPVALYKRPLDEPAEPNTSHNKMLKLHPSFSASASIHFSNIDNEIHEGPTPLINTNGQAKEELSKSDNEDSKTQHYELNMHATDVPESSEVSTDGLQQDYEDAPKDITSSQTNIPPAELSGSDNENNRDIPKDIISIEANVPTEELSKSDNEDEPSNENIENATNIENENNEFDTQVPSASGNAADTKKVLRDKCWYGSNCYRKSSHHKKDFSHPGDSDYESDPNDTRPVCGYGADCYRKNKDHRQNYKHPRTDKKMRPKQKRRAVKKPRNEAIEESSEDDYDYDDPFLDDDSADEYLEESWSESETDDYDVDDEEDNTKALMKEAKRFVRKNK